MLAALGLVSTILAVGGPGLGSPAAATGYTPPSGVHTNNPLGDRTHRRAIMRQVIRTIDSAPRRSQIKVASWNIRSDAFVAALIRAHRRHVGVRVLLSRGNATRGNPNLGVNRLERALRRFGNKTRHPFLRSRLKKCVSSCRGQSGIAHSKFFLFSRAGNARYIVMNGSFNATDLASSNQWNDLFIVRGRARLHAEFADVFAQMWRDHPVSQGFRTRNIGPLTTMFYPYTGRNTGTDPVLKELDRVRCSGARNTRGGHTKIRIAMTSWFGPRGKLIASRVRQLQEQGCNIRIIYAVMGNEVSRILRYRGARPVPRRHIVQDFNADGVYDRYLHTKVMTIKGGYGDDRRAFVTLNGSANWSPAVLASDEAVIRVEGRHILQRYNTWIEGLFAHPPPRRRLSAAVRARVASGVVDPYAKVEAN